MVKYSEEIVDYVKMIVDESQRKRLAKSQEYRDMKDIINEVTNFLDASAEIKERCWYILNDIIDAKICPSCETNQLRYIPKFRRFQVGCCVACARRLDLGKRVETWKNNYGVDNPWKSVEIRDKIKLVNIERYGVDHPFKSENIQEKRKATILERYGVDHHWKSADGQSKRKTTILERYGVDHHSSALISDIARIRLNDSGWLNEQHIILKRTITNISEELGVNKNTVLLAFKKLNLKIVRHRISNGHREILEFLKNNFDFEILINDRNTINLELDILIPSKKLAIEYDGMFWHSTAMGKDSTYHLNKTKDCENLGIQLIHIFENEWILRQDIVKSRLLSILGKSHRIFARKCEIQKLTSSEASIFFNDNHLQGSVGSSVKYGLVYDGELVAAMSFGKPRFNKRFEWELIRYSSKVGTTIIGGSSKLFKKFIDDFNPRSIISYADRRYSIGRMYELLGFIKIYETSPNHFYFKEDIVLESRYQYQKHKLRDKLEIFDESKTGVENMLENGWNMIWDCGNLVYIWGVSRDS